MSAPTQPRITPSPEILSMPLVPRSLEGARVAQDNATQLAETAASHAQRYDTTRQHLGQSAIDQADLLAGSSSERLQTLQSLRDEQSAATVAAAESQLNGSKAKQHWLAFMVASGGIRVNRHTPRSAMIAMESRE